MGILQDRISLGRPIEMLFLEVTLLAAAAERYWDPYLGAIFGSYIAGCCSGLTFGSNIAEPHSSHYSSHQAFNMAPECDSAAAMPLQQRGSQIWLPCMAPNIAPLQQLAMWLPNMPPKKHPNGISMGHPNKMSQEYTVS